MMNFILGTIMFAVNLVVGLIIFLFGIIWIPLVSCTRFADILFRKLIGADPPK